MLRPLMLASALLLATPAFAQQTYIEDQDQQNQPQRTQRMQGMPVPLAALMRGERLERLLGALSTGTFFRVKHGDDEIIVHCPARRQLQDCVTAAASLVHEVPHMGQETDENEQSEQNEQNDQTQHQH